jgi:hypothetical protein
MTTPLFSAGSRVFLLGIFVLILVFSAAGQTPNTLFDDRRIGSIHIDIQPDSLQKLLQNLTSNTYYKCRMVFDDGQRKDTIPNIGFRLRGNTSRLAKKKSFKISFNTFVSGRRYQGVRKYNLDGTHNDPTMIREKLFYEVWNKAGMPHRRTVFVRLYINQEYRGLYSGLEDLDKEWLRRVYGEANGADDGNLYQCGFPADLVYQGPNQQAYKDVAASSLTGGRAYDLETNEDEDDYSGFVRLVETLALSNPDTFLARIHSVLNVRLYLKALALDVATGNWDNYAYNKNNYFLYHNPLTNQFDFITYDTDNTFGVDWIGLNWALRNCGNWIHPTQSRPLAQKLLAVPAFRAEYFHQLDSLTRFVCHPDSLFPRIDEMHAQIESAAAEDVFRTLDHGYDMAKFHQGFTGTVAGHLPYGIKPFLTARMLATQGQLLLLRKETALEAEPELHFFPNPIQMGRELHIFHPAGVENIQVLDSWGREKAYIHLRDGVGPHLWRPELPRAGVYWLRWKGKQGMKVQRMVLW